MLGDTLLNFSVRPTVYFAKVSHFTKLSCGVENYGIALLERDTRKKNNNNQRRIRVKNATLNQRRSVNIASSLLSLTD